MVWRKALYGILAQNLCNLINLNGREGLTIFNTVKPS